MVQENSFQETVDALRSGNPAVYPTETVYGLGVAVAFAENPSVLYDIKQREQRKPIAWLVSDASDLDHYGKHVPEFARVLARTFWPGPLTLIVSASDEVPSAFRSNEGTIGLRMPNNEKALELISAVGCPLATTSANISGLKAPKTFGNLSEDVCRQVSAVLKDDDDVNKSGVASTVLDCTGDHPVMVREGAISISDIRTLS